MGNFTSGCEELNYPNFHGKFNLSNFAGSGRNRHRTKWFVLSSLRKGQRANPLSGIHTSKSCHRTSQHQSFAPPNKPTLMCFPPSHAAERSTNCRTFGLHSGVLRACLKTLREPFLSIAVSSAWSPSSGPGLSLTQDLSTWSLVDVRRLILRQVMTLH